MKVPQIDVQAQYFSIRDEVDGAIRSVLESGNFILGPTVEALEQEVAAYVGVRHAVGVASGTDALLLTLRALGIGPGSEVIVPAFTFFATAEVVMLLGATPVLVDVAPDTYCLDVRHVERALTPRTRAVIPVHLFGHSADMAPLLDLAARHHLLVVEDNAQAIGAEYRGRKTGALGNGGCLSFYPTKNLAAFGDGGMVVTDDERLADQVRVLRTHGWRRKYYPEEVGYNSRLDELQAAVLRVKLRYLDRWNRRRRELARLYTAQLSPLGVRLPQEAPDCQHVYHLYVVEVPDRERVRQELQEAGVSTAVYYPYPLHLVPAMRSLGYRKGDFPVSEAAAERCLALPLYPEMTDEQSSWVAQALGKAITSGVKG